MAYFNLIPVLTNYQAHYPEICSVDPSIAMDISSERLRQEIPFDFAGATVTSENVNGIENIHNNNGLEVKETNNNHVTMDMSGYATDIWPQIDSSMLDDLNTWTSETPVKDNTDGAIYTLTVLNGADQANWFKPEEKEVKMPNSSLDLESILNVIPSTFPNTIQIPTEVKTGEFNFEDSGFEMKKELNMSEIGLTNSAFDNNNEWKQDNNNEVDSLLRNALQGKTIIRYNGIKKEPKEDDEKIAIENPMLYENFDSDNPSSAHSMDELFLTQLDVASYPEDMEKLRRIETEVAESVEQFMDRRSYIPSGSQLSPQLPVGIASRLQTAKSGKKYTKRSKSTTPTASSSGVRKERSLHYCTICNKGFKDKYSVNVHIRTHTGEKPFTCTFCGKSFRQKAHLAKHYQTHMAQAKNGLSPSKSAKNLISSS